MAYITSLEISTTDGDTTVNIQTIIGSVNAPVPLATPISRPVQVETAAGTVVEHGGYVFSWRFPSLTEAQWDALRTLLPNKTTPVWVRTLDADKFDYVYLSANCIWPNEPDITRPAADPTHSTGEFILQFRNGIIYTPTPPPS